MIVNRRTFLPKSGRMAEAIAHLQAEVKRLDRAHAVRITRCNIGREGLVAAEWDFENLREYEEFWAAYFGTPETDAFLEIWYELTEPGRTSEIWPLME